MAYYMWKQYELGVKIMKKAFNCILHPHFTCLFLRKSKRGVVFLAGERTIECQMKSENYLKWFGLEVLS